MLLYALCTPYEVVLIYTIWYLIDKYGLYIFLVYQTWFYLTRQFFKPMRDLLDYSRYIQYCRAFTVKYGVETNCIISPVEMSPAEPSVEFTK